MLHCSKLTIVVSFAATIRGAALNMDPTFLILRIGETYFSMFILNGIFV